MLNLSELTLYYIQITFQEELRKVIYSSFNLLEMFGLKFYEDKYTELIPREDTIDNENKRDNFLFLLKKDINDIIKEHHIFLDADMNISLNEYNEIAHFLYIVQNLEDYSEVSYRLHAQDKAKNIIVDLIEKLTLLSKSRLLEIIEKVDDSLIDSLKSYIEDKESENSTYESVDKKRIKYIQSFFKFINNHPCSGYTYYNNGYTSITIEDFSNLINENITNSIDNRILNNLPQAALDVLSILIITKDNYNLPLIKFAKYNYLFTNKLENVTKLNNVMLSILNDFNMFLEAEKQMKELAND